MTLIIGIIATDKFLPSKARRALPDSATDVQEYYYDSGFIGDFTRIIKARIPAHDFQNYARNLGLQHKYNPKTHKAEYDSLKMKIGNMPVWWDEPNNLDNCYFQHTPGDEYFERIKWQDGWVYFIAFAW